MRFYILLLLLFGSIHRGISQVPEWNGELEGSGKISFSDTVMLFFTNFLVPKSWHT